MLYGSVCRALIWWEPLCMTSKDTVMPQNLKADVSVLCQNIQGKVCFTLMKTSINRPWHLISIYVWGGGEHRKCHIVMYEHSLLWVEFFFLSFFFVLLLQCDKLPSPHFLQAPMRGWIYLLLFDISQMEYNTAQKQYFTLCLGAETIGISDESGRLISLLHAFTVWQFWKGQLGNSNALQSYFIFDYIMLVIPQAILQQSKVFDDTEVAVATKKTLCYANEAIMEIFFFGGGLITSEHIWYLLWSLFGFGFTFCSCRIKYFICCLNIFLALSQRFICVSERIQSCSNTHTPCAPLLTFTYCWH